MMRPMGEDWDQLGTLHSRFGHTIRTDPLWVLVTTAMQGHEGSVEDMWVIMSDGVRYDPKQIRLLAERRDRKPA
jgi:hypothetical protein